MSDLLIQEVTEAVRRDRAEKFWVENRALLIALVVAIIAGTAGGQIYRNWKHAKNEQFSSTLVKATASINGGNAQTAIEPLTALVKTSRGEQKAVAGLWLARAQIGSGATKDAQATLSDIVKTAGKNSVWQDTACIWSAGLGEGWPEGCDASAGSPLQALKLELAAADAIGKQEWEQARTLLAKLHELTANLPEQQKRATQLQLLLPPEAAKAPADPVPSAKE